MSNIRELKTTEVQKFRKFLLHKQKGICPVCELKITDPVLDHSHKKRIGGSGKCRGVVCRTCNVFLAKSENNAVRYRIKIVDLPRILRNIAKYLEKPHLPYLHPSERNKPKKLKLSSYKKLQKAWDGKGIFPPYPERGGVTIKLTALFTKYGIEPEFYK